jgi:glutamyl-tRNA reductase
MLVDIGVPRNITNESGELPGVDAYDVDDLQEVVARNQEARREIAAEAEGLLREEAQLFLEWWDGLEAVPLVNRLRLQLEEIREQELQKALSRMGPDLSARERKVVEALSKGIINKILHTPVTRLRAPQPRPQRHMAMRVMQDLFELHEGQPEG